MSTSCQKYSLGSGCCSCAQSGIGCAYDPTAPLPAAPAPTALKFDHHPSLSRAVAQAKAEMASWSPELRASVRLEGGDAVAPAEQAGDVSFCTNGGTPMATYTPAKLDQDWEQAGELPPLLTRDVIDGLNRLNDSMPLSDDVPQPIAGTIVLLETFARLGMTAERDGKPTPNSLLCSRFAAELRALVARQAPTDAPKGGN